MLIMGKPIKQLCPLYRFFAPYYIPSFIAFGSCCMLGIFDIVCSWMKQKIISVSWKLNFKFRGFHALFTIMPVWRDRQQTVSHFMLSFFPFVFWRHLIATVNMWITCERSEEVKINSKRGLTILFNSEVRTQTLITSGERGFIFVDADPLRPIYFWQSGANRGYCRE